MTPGARPGSGMCAGLILVLLPSVFYYMGQNYFFIVSFAFVSIAAYIYVLHFIYLVTYLFIG